MPSRAEIVDFCETAFETLEIASQRACLLQENFIIILLSETDIYKKIKRVSKGFANPLAKSRGRVSGGVWGNAPHTVLKRSAKGELKISPSDWFLRGNALQVRAFLLTLPNLFQSVLIYYIC